MLKRIYLLLLGFIQFSIAVAQEPVINAEEVSRIIHVLASDSMKGRKIFTPEIDSAAKFIAHEFTQSGLKYFDTLDSYSQTFYMVENQDYHPTGTVGGRELEPENIIVTTSREHIAVDEHSGFAIHFIDSSENFFRSVYPLLRVDTSQVIFVSPHHARNFSRLRKFHRPFFDSRPPVIMALADSLPKTFHIESSGTPRKLALHNVVGILPGKSKRNEYVLFSAHYDHLGVGKPDVMGDSIYNGANDDASGTTAVIALAKYFAQKADNERTLVFVAFTAEESGGYGSKYFSQQLDPDKIVAMFNIEMIGTPSKWGPGHAYITGYERSDFGKILQQNIPDSSFIFHPDPYPKQNLFYRSDNATLAALGVPAHTISTSIMDKEPYYHRPGDEVSTLDMEQLAHTIRAIAHSSRSIVMGEDTPARVEKLGR